MKLIIVESPTKARTFNKILKDQNKDYFVFATVGHIRDLPKGKLGVDYENNFEPSYINVKNKKKVIKELKSFAKKYDQIILATDLDREGESIAYHVAYLLGFIKEKWPDFKIVDNKHRLKRIIFHEITSSALKEALEKPKSLRVSLIKAQQARRILDRIVGYEVSPVIWRKIGKFWLSAGRVQTIALRLIVEREKEIRNFKPEKYFQIYGDFVDGQSLRGRLVKYDNKKIDQTFTLELFTGLYKYRKTTINNKNLDKIKKEINKETFSVKKIKENIVKRTPPPPFTTSTLQQNAFNRFGFSSKMTMKLAQDLYERGLITYHRTDSFVLSLKFISTAKKFIEKKYGKDYSLENPRAYKTKSKLAQEAHEAIRPTKVEKTVDKLDSVKRKLSTRHKHLYELIFNRALATQMREASIKNIKILVGGEKNYIFSIDWQEVVFPGFLKVLNPDFIKKHQVGLKIVQGKKIDLKELDIQEKETNPPPRYNEASLIRTLEERGIGRPSTYAAIVSLIQEKGYTEKVNRQFCSTKLGEVISDYLSKAFAKIFNLEFTVKMEQNLDQIAENDKNVVDVLSELYKPFKKELEKSKKDQGHINVEEETEEKCPKCNKKMVIRFSRFGKFLACSGYPKCKTTKPFLKVVKDEKCPKCSGKIVIRFTKKRKRFFGCENYPKCKFRAWKLAKKESLKKKKV